MPVTHIHAACIVSTEKMVDPELARTFAFYGSLLLAKMGLMAPLTARQRISKKVIL